MLEAGERFIDKKADILCDIQFATGVIPIARRCIQTFPEQAEAWKVTLTDLQELRQQKIEELIELKRWRIRNKVGENEIWQRVQISKSSE